MTRPSAWIFAAVCALHIGSAYALVASISTTTSLTPEIFAPGVISGSANEDSAAFTPDGNTIYFDRSNGPNVTILESHLRDGKWSTPKVAAFSGRWLDHDVSIAPDGSFIVFVSNRPATDEGKTLDAIVHGKPVADMGGNLWRVDRNGAGWSEAVRLPDVVNASTRTYSPSIAGDGSIYFQQPDKDSGEFHLWRSPYANGAYQTPTRVLLGEAGTHELDPAIAPDESFIVFDSNAAAKDGPDRLFIAFHDHDQWSAPIDLGDALNSKSNPWGAHLGPDHHSLYFSSDRKTRVTYPRTREQTVQDVARWQSWDSGNDNIWRVSLAPWLDAHKAQG